ncbi:MAG: PA2169 family four-helix-bundle protein [Chloroflexi bacterium AL-W]|nr:PA2169 family four-helix-bundle protein [Chloroflexi bacterium AL-N1]NOK68111.1 PA2169 family four-helix-bundle protein [Chloroflexi bacterium AL-N10]NOK73451.1 PA2169 family four-helix-bundle protein [Chloroflexi bacterium AL-N5]NOK83365.1 PA2169 family four-helix-bundle protein [Chloroflexi bacterium AL-W]NOK87782.1 PA2169 family four-helix-bundle protein [Chloroflexi bacterium AL-N15]
MDNNSIVNELNDLIEICKDGQKGYQQAAENVDDQGYTTMFNRYAKERGQAAAELQQEVTRLGGQPETDGSTAAQLHRTWMDLRSALGVSDTAERRQRILEECVRGDTAAKERFEEVLKKGLPTNVQSTVERQYEEVTAALRAMSDMAATK